MIWIEKHRLADDDIELLNREVSYGVGHLKHFADRFCYRVLQDDDGDCQGLLDTWRHVNAWNFDTGPDMGRNLGCRVSAHGWKDVRATESLVAAFADS